MNQFGICPTCAGDKTKELISRLKEIDNKAEIIEGCQNLCGIGRTKLFVVVNHIPVIADNLDELIGKVKENIK